MTQARRTAFISGAGRNIGRAVALKLAAAGHDVVVNGRSDEAACEETAQMVRDLGADARVVMGDVGDRQAVDRIVDQCLQAHGTIDLLVNNAAIRPGAPFLEMSDEDWHGVLNVDLNAAFYFSRAFLPGMVERGWGRIVNLTGLHSIQGYNGRAAVSVAKHGLWGLTKALAKEFGARGVTVNAVSPGAIRTEHEDAQRAERMKRSLASIPVGRLGEPDDIAELVAFLCSDAGSYISGQMIACNGGAQT